MATKYLDYDGLLYFWTLLKAKFAKPSDANPAMDGTADPGDSVLYARGNHVHPHDSTKVDAVAGKGLSTNDFTDAMETKLTNIEAGAEVNVIESVKVNSTALAVSSKAVSIPNATTAAYGCTKLSSATNSTSEALAATPKAVKAAYDLANGKQSPATTIAGYGITDAKIDEGVITLGSNTITPLTAASSLDASKLTGTASVNTTGNAATANKVNHDLVLKIKTGTTEGTNLYTFNGSAAKTLDIKQGSNVTLTAAAGSLTIAAKDTTYTPASAMPLMDGTGAVGTSVKYAREDHVHPSDTSKVDVVEGKGLSTNDFTDALETKLNGIAAGAQVNVIEGVKVNSTALTPSSKIVSIPNATTAAYGCTKLSSATNSTSEALAATPKAVKAAYDLANSKQSPATTLSGYGITNAYTKTEIDAKLTAGMHYKGSVQTVADLPASGNQTGDFYNVLLTGENYAWDGSAWDQVGSMVDLAAITNAEIDTIVAS